MSFAKSTVGGGRQTEFAHVKWTTNKPNLRTPNLEFYNAETKEKSYLLGENEFGSIHVTGKIINVLAFAREGYNDQQAGKGEKNEWRLLTIFDNGPDKPLSGLTMDLISDTGVPNGNTVQYLSTLAQHLENGGKDVPVQVNIYRKYDKTDKAKWYPASIIRLPDGEDTEGQPTFGDSSNFVRTEGLPPRGEPVMVNGKHFEANGQKAYTWDALTAFAEEKMGIIMKHFPPKNQAPIEQPDQGQATPEDAADQGIELAGAVDAAVATPDRQRMGGAA